MEGTSTRKGERERPYSVAALNRDARALLEGAFAGVWLEAEISEVTVARSGHIYFRLADPDRKAQLDAVMWRGHAMRYQGRVTAGARVLVRGRVTLYEAGGRFQLVAESVEEAGAGQKARRLAELKARLEAEGLFAPERKRPLPAYPRCVGVVTSRSGAVIRDIWRVISRRFPTRVLLAHAAVQGDAAAAEIAEAMATLGGLGEADVVIVGRGGGAAEDLDAFNDEAVVRAIAACPVPVVSAVGHEVDFTLADLAADRRAATPSEAAELVVPQIEHVAGRLADARAALTARMRSAVVARRGELADANGRLRTRDPRTRLRVGMERLSGARERLATWPGRRLAGERAALGSLAMRLGGWPGPALSRSRSDLVSAAEGVYRWTDPAVERARGRLGRLAARLEALSPLAALARGYSVVRRADDGGLVRGPAQAPVGTRLRITVARGELGATVTEAGGREGEGEA
jgi:exodeoxyribonuclease VII large subunit